MCSWNWEKIENVDKEFYFYIKETSENACFYFMIGFLWSVYSDAAATWVNRKKMKSSKKENIM